MEHNFSRGVMERYNFLISLKEGKNYPIIPIKFAKKRQTKKKLINNTR